MQNKWKKMRGRGEEEETERGEGREGTLIINATGHRPFKIFKIKKKRYCYQQEHFMFLPFSSFLHEYYFLIWKKSKVTQHLKWSMNLSRSTLSLKFSDSTMLVMVWEQCL